MHDIDLGAPPTERAMIFETEAGRISVDQLGSGPDVILLHSLLSDRNSFGKIVPSMIRSYRVSLVDLPGFGSTEMTEPTIDAYADMIGGLLAVGDFDHDHTVLLGNGLGAFVALGTAIRHGDRFGKLILSGVGSHFPEDAKMPFKNMIGLAGEKGMDALVDVAVRRIFSADYLAEHPEQAEERKTVLRRTKPEAFIAACRALIDLDYRDQVSTVTNPTMIVVGSEDEATTPAMAAELASSVPGARLEIMQGVAHAPQLQTPVEFWGLVQSFLTD